MNIGTEVGLMPAKVSLNMRAMVTAGWVNEVEEVNQYASPIQGATAAAESGARPVRARVSARSVGSPPATGAGPAASGKDEGRAVVVCRSQLVKEPGPLDGVTPSCGA